MTSIKMPQTVVEFFKMDPDKFAASGAINTFVALDTALFVDPLRLAEATTPEFVGSRQKVLDYFSQTLLLIRMTNDPSDQTWTRASERFVFREIAGYGLGYARGSTLGSGIGPQLRTRLLKTAREIVSKGIVEPEIFELIGIFEEGIGPDRLSDMVCSILLEEFCAFTERVAQQCGACNVASFRVGSRSYSLPWTLRREERVAVLFVPQELVRQLPIAKSFEDIETIANHNRTLREALNRQFGEEWRSRVRRFRKADVRQVLLRTPECVREIIDEYRSRRPRPYDVNSDPEGLLNWGAQGKHIADVHPLQFTLSPGSSDSERAEQIVAQICEQFRDLVENNRLHKLLYADDACTKPRKEKQSQLLFFAIAYSYCVAHNLDISPECDPGRGPVDFKFSSGMRAKVLVELKLSTNKKLLAGLERQVPAYAAAEKSDRSYYVVIQVAESRTGIERLEKRVAELQKQGLEYPKVLYVDALPQESASKLA
jgi:hypothetical protein